MSGGAGGWRSGRVVVVLGHGGSVVEAALRSVGLVRVCEAEGGEVWAPPDLDKEGADVTSSLALRGVSIAPRPGMRQC